MTTRDSESPAGAVNGVVEPLRVRRAYEPVSPYLLVEDVAARLRCSVRSIHELTRTCSIPHRRLPGARRCLFVEAELAAWEDGAEVEVQELPRGGRVVRLKGES